MRNQMRPGVILERDGVILRRTANNCLSSWQEVDFLPRALDALRLFAERGLAVVIVSHQPAVGNGQLTIHELNALTRRMLLEVAMAGGRIDKVYYCPHGAQENCFCKKPFPGLLLRAMTEQSLCAAETYAISEGETGLEAASRAGCRRILLRRDSFLTGETRRDDSVEIASSLFDAAERILQRNGSFNGGVLRGEHFFALRPTQLRPNTNCLHKDEELA